MAPGAQGNPDRVVVALLAADLLVVDLQVLSGTADLTLPASPLEYLLPKLLVQLGSQRKRGRLGGICFTRFFRSLLAERPAFVRQEGIRKTMTLTAGTQLSPRFRDLPLPGSLHRSSLGNIRATCPFPASKLLFQSPARLPESGSCT